MRNGNCTLQPACSKNTYGRASRLGYNKLLTAQRIACGATSERDTLRPRHEEEETIEKKDVVTFPTSRLTAHRALYLQLQADSNPSYWYFFFSRTAGAGRLS